MRDIITTLFSEKRIKLPTTSEDNDNSITNVSVDANFFDTSGSEIATRKKKNLLKSVQVNKLERNSEIRKVHSKVSETP